MTEKSYNVTVGEVLHNLHALCDGYEKVIAGENFQCRAADAAVTVKAAAVLVSQLPYWIPVAERLPEQGVRVLVYDGDFRQCEIGDYYADMGWAGSEMLRPTHWMPLPSAPPETKS